MWICSAKMVDLPPDSPNWWSSLRGTLHQIRLWWSWRKLPTIPLVTQKNGSILFLSVSSSSSSPSRRTHRASTPATPHPTGQLSRPRRLPTPYGCARQLRPRWTRLRPLADATPAGRYYACRAVPGLLWPHLPTFEDIGHAVPPVASSASFCPAVLHGTEKKEMESSDAWGRSGGEI